MTWAYHPLLPVQTAPDSKVLADDPHIQQVNDTMTLVVVEQAFVAEGRMLRLDLLWEATGVSPVDYLTEVSLVDQTGQIRTQWLGYSANGRYPTRAWDVGDYVRDTAWLSLAGLAAGQYDVTLNLRPTTRNPMTQIPPELGESFMRTHLTLDQPVAAASALQIWQQGEPVATPHRFGYRETVLVTWPEAVNNIETVQITGPLEAEAPQVFAPVGNLPNRGALFIVGPDWVTGEYQVQVLEDGKPVGGPRFTVIDRWQRQFREPPVTHRVEANFADQVKLVGYDLGANRAEPGGGVPLTLYWQGLDWLGSDYTIFIKLLAADQSVHGGRDRLPNEGYRTLYWAPGEFITDPFGLPVNPDAPPGIYTINIGLYQQVGEQAVSLPLVQDGQPLEATSITIGPIKIGDTPPGLTITEADPQNPLNQPFGDAPNLTLLGYNLTDENGLHISQSSTLPLLQPSNLYLTLYWRSEAPLPADYTTFVHLRDAAGENVTQKDQPPLMGAYPTSLWDPGELLADLIDVPLPTELPAGEYDVVIGLYDFQTGQRLTMPENPAREVRLTTLVVP